MAAADSGGRNKNHTYDKNAGKTAQWQEESRRREYARKQAQKQAEEYARRQAEEQARKQEEERRYKQKAERKAAELREKEKRKRASTKRLAFGLIAALLVFLYVFFANHIQN